MEERASLVPHICPKHRDYKAVLRPRVPCFACWWLWFVHHATEISLSDIDSLKVARQMTEPPKEW